MSALNRKLFRELWRLRGQVFAIGMVIASGVATLVMALSTVEALEETSQAYYDRYRFGDVFAGAVRAPERLKEAIAELPGVQTVQTRISKLATVDIDGFEEPIVGFMTSIPDDKQPLLNQLALRKGRWVSGGASDEVIINEPFAQAHGLGLGDQFHVVINGKKRLVVVVGVALCPEFIYSLSPAALVPDDKRFGVMWMSRGALEAAYDLEGAFNDVTLALLKGAPVQPVLDGLDVLLEPYGGRSAIARSDQISNWFVMNEIEQQKTMGTILPSIFIAVAVFLTNMVLARLIATERTEIGLLKAFGYSNLQIGWHYTKMIAVMSGIGILIGSGLGIGFGRLNTEMYAELFRFPLLIYRPSPFAFLVSGSLSLAAALIGGVSAIRKAVTLPPAQAMQPPSPPIYRHGVLSSSLLTRWLDQPTRIALRQIARWPIRSAATSAGIACSVGLLVMTLQWEDSLNHMARVFFFDAQRQTITVGMAEAQADSTVSDLRHLPGVMHAEPMRMLGAEFKYGTRSHRGTLTAITQESYLQPIYDDGTRQVLVTPEFGLVLASRLAKKLRVTVGDEVWVEILEDKRPMLLLPVVGVFDTYIGLPAFINKAYLDPLLEGGSRFEYANLLVDPLLEPTLFKELKAVPAVSSVMAKRSAFLSFHDTLIQHLMVFVFMFTALASILAAGVTYNSTRISLSERGRELATLRVLGFSKGEVSYVLLGEVMIVILVGLPLGCLMGYGLVLSMAAAFDTELFRVPLLVEPSTYAIAIMVVLTASVLSALLVRHRINKLNLISVLKTRE